MNSPLSVWYPPTPVQVEFLPDKFYISIDRTDLDGSPWPDGDVIIGPFDTVEEGTAYFESGDVDDWCTNEAKSKGFVVDDVWLVKAGKNMTIPKDGIQPYDEDMLATMLEIVRTA